MSSILKKGNVTMITHIKWRSQLKEPITQLVHNQCDLKSGY